MSKAKRPDNPFTLRINEILFKITLVENVRLPGARSDDLEPQLRDEGWGAWFGEIQEALRSSAYNEEHFHQVHLDLSLCTWVDPTPILSLAIALNEFDNASLEGSTRTTQRKVRISLPSDLPQLNDKPNYLDQRARVRHYLAQEGFLDILIDPDAISSPLRLNKPLNINIKEESLDNFRKFTLGTEENPSKSYKLCLDDQAPAAYVSSTCLRAELLRIEPYSDLYNHKDFTDRPVFSLDDIDAWVEDRLARKISPVINEKVPRWAHSGIKYRIQSVLRELLHNVALHAYGNKRIGFAGVYIRYRQGLLAAENSIRLSLSEFINNEDKGQAVPLLPRDFVDERTGFFEIFVIDAGIGLCQSLGNTGKKGYKPSPLKKTIQDVLLDGQRRRENQSTRYGGLRLLRELMEGPRDHLRIRDEDEWWGKTLPMDRKGIRETLSACGDNHPVLGLSWSIRASWVDDSDLVDPEHWIAEKADLLPILKEGRGNITEYRAIGINDLRFKPRVTNNQGKDSTFDDSLLKMPLDDRSSQIAVLLPQVRWMKNVIHDNVKTFCTAAELSNRGTLIIGDIHPHEAATYLSALAETKNIPKKKRIPINRLILVTRNLRACVILKNNGILSFSRSDTESFSLSSYSGITGSINCLADYFRLLRWHDSKQFWRTIRDEFKESELAYLVCSDKEKIPWNKTLKLSEYLDFAQTLTHPTCRKIYALSLARLPAILQFPCNRINPLDTLVAGLITMTNAELHPHINGKTQSMEQVSVGSIQVSGTTQCNYPTTSLVFHFFRHPNATSIINKAYLLLWPKMEGRWKQHFKGPAKQYSPPIENLHSCKIVHSSYRNADFRLVVNIF
jgi:hypothetical protein